MSDLLTLTEVAERLRMPEATTARTLKRRVRRLGIPYYQVGPQWLVERDELESWISEQRRSPRVFAFHSRTGRRRSK